VQNIGYKSRDLLALTGAAVTMVEKCSGHDGTWAMKAEYFDESMKVGKKLFDGLAEAKARSSPPTAPWPASRSARDGRSGEAPDRAAQDAYGIVA